MDRKKIGWLWVVSMVVSLYTTFVVQSLWNWFVATTFNISSVSYWQMYGLVLVISLLSDSGKEFVDEQRWKSISTVIEIGFPEEKREALKESIKLLNEESLGDLGGKIFGKVVGNTVTLAIGWIVHTWFI